MIFGDGQSVEMDYFVIAFGSISDHKLYETIRNKHETYLIGDVVKTGKIIDAVSEGYAIGRIV
ncbi:hypothetical protein CSE_13940 [Caldisericum exile AZM16c01]|uniref:FAD/NAD(P)-binding domain-containing protein n=2 Tax=Caldisericum exile TaxID=693075 RepID=A0A7U6GFN7_CALEA|nr:hypothetical protein CSE_13940 [Caldisericum exile AZM16c01]